MLVLNSATSLNLSVSSSDLCICVCVLKILIYKVLSVKRYSFVSLFLVWTLLFFFLLNCSWWNCQYSRLVVMKAGILTLFINFWEKPLVFHHWVSRQLWAFQKCPLQTREEWREKSRDRCCEHSAELTADHGRGEEWGYKACSLYPWTLLTEWSAHTMEAEPSQWGRDQI